MLADTRQNYRTEQRDTNGTHIARVNGRSDTQRATQNEGIRCHDRNQTGSTVLLGQTGKKRAKLIHHGKAPTAPSGAPHEGSWTRGKAERKGPLTDHVSHSDVTPVVMAAKPGEQQQWL